MHTMHTRLLTLAALLLLLGPPAAAQPGGTARLKDLVRLEGTAVRQLTGFGLVVGLDRTGDRARGVRGAPYTVQSIANMLQRFGIPVDPALLTSRNAAAVMVTATLDPFETAGNQIDVTVSALGDARSLSGGLLLQTPLQDPTTGEVYAMAQGPVSTGAVLASTVGSSVQINYTNTGRIPRGATVVRTSPVDLSGRETLGLALKRPDFTNATRIREVINQAYPDAAEVVHAGLVRVTVPEGVEGANALMAALEELSVAVDVPARVVVNERTGTIVAGGEVRISEVMVTYGSIIISTRQDPFVSQPPPLSGGETVSGTVSTTTIEEEGTRTIVLPANTDINELAAALNELGLTSRDVIAIFQTIDRAGALQGDLIIQ